MSKATIVVPRAILFAAVFIVVVGVAAGVAYATIPDGGGVIHGCYQKNNGQLRVIETGAGGACNPSELSLNWSHGVPREPPARPAPQEPRGQLVTGPRGPSDAFEAFRFATTVNVTNVSTEITKIPALPAGSYVITGKVNVDNVSGGSGDVNCPRSSRAASTTSARQASARAAGRSRAPRSPRRSARRSPVRRTSQ